MKITIKAKAVCQGTRHTNYACGNVRHYNATIEARASERNGGDPEIIVSPPPDWARPDPYSDPVCLQCQRENKELP